MTDKEEALKRALFMEGLEAIEDFLGYEINPKENKDVIDRRMDEVLDQMPDEEFETFYNKYVTNEKERE